MRSCVIFNPTARGDKAKRFRKQLDLIAKECAFKPTASAGDARKLAMAAVQEGFDTIVAAGGDGTLNEVLNGIGDAPNGFERSRLAVLPLGTVNVFAREVGIPVNLDGAWETIRKGNDTHIDLPRVEYQNGETCEHRYFAQLAGAGLDARAIELVKWQVKKMIGPLAYVIAGFHALLGPPAKIQVSGPNGTFPADMVMIGNGRLYGGEFRLFPKADLRDGLLEVCILPRVNWYTLARCTPRLLLMRTLPSSAATNLQSPELTLTSDLPVPLQLDGELVGHLPAKFTVEKKALRVVIP